MKTYQVLFVSKHQYYTVKHKRIIYDCLQVIHISVQKLFWITWHMRACFDFITWNSCLAFPSLSRSRLSTTYICINIHIFINLAIVDLYHVFSVGGCNRRKNSQLPNCTSCILIKIKMHKTMKTNSYQTISVVEIVPPKCP